MLTGLVFDLPHGRWMADVLRLRALYDPIRLRFPIEIAVVGSSGLGWFSPTHSKADLLAHVGEVAKLFAPFAFRFEKIGRFPDTNVYYLCPRDNTRLHDFQRRLGRCGLRFEPTPFGYVPHCTLVMLPDPAMDSVHGEIMACPVPSDEIRVSSVSFYRVDASEQHCWQEERVALGG